MKDVCVGISGEPPRSLHEPLLAKDAEPENLHGGNGHASGSRKQVVAAIITIRKRGAQGGIFQN
jgi:hypothetical protein